MHTFDDPQAPEEHEETFTKVCEFPVTDSAPATDSAKAPPRMRSREDPLVEISYQHELARIVRAWENERQPFLLTDFSGRRHVPTLRRGNRTILLGGLFGLFWILLAPALLRSVFEPGLLLVAVSGFVLLGIVMVVGLVCHGIYECLLARQYTRTFAAYHAHCMKIQRRQQNEPAVDARNLHKDSAPQCRME